MNLKEKGRIGEELEKRYDVLHMCEVLKILF